MHHEEEEEEEEIDRLRLEANDYRQALVTIWHNLKAVNQALKETTRALNIISMAIEQTNALDADVAIEAVDEFGLPLHA